jgi:hypothetical protein
MKRKPKPRHRRRRIKREQPPPIQPPRYQVVMVEHLRDDLRPIIESGLIAAIEHCQSFWRIDEGYKKYIDHQIAQQAEALTHSLRQVLREEREAYGNRGTTKKRR